jgi:putative ABC transport system permease protein
MKKIIPAFAMAFRAMKGQILQTFLSILGMVIGVAALVGILCLIDGMEKFAKDQITQTTSLNSILVSSKSTRSENGVVVKKDTFAYLSPTQFEKLQHDLSGQAKMMLLSTQSAEVVHPATSKKMLSVWYGATPSMDDQAESKLLAGRLLNQEDVQSARKVVLVNKTFAQLFSPSDSVTALVGKNLLMRGENYEVIGVINLSTKSPEVFVPISLFTPTDFKNYPPSVIIEVNEVDQVNPVKEKISDWLKKEYGAKRTDFDIATNGFRVEQAEQGFRLFRVIMGLIVGISVLVGGVGVMNVMLISVTQRTTEIGVRKALGAKRQDIVFQFLAESISISAFGSLCGLILGVLGTMATIPIIRAITKVPFQASYTWNTIAMVSLIAIVVGIVFGTYPALRASRLDPVEAIRREQ